MGEERLVERRIVSVLFADLVGFTSLSEALDPEDVATIQDAYFGAVRETVARYGGTVEKFIGDAVMAVYGLPRARDDDAERAVRTGLALIAAVERIGADLAAHGLALRLRVGVNSGEVASAEGGPDQVRVTGDTVNVAARFQAAAGPGEVLVGQGTALAVAESVELEPRGEIELKGKRRPVHAWRAVGLRPQRSREAAMGRLRAPMLGRAAELAALREAADRVAARGGAARWLIIAPPGTGKSRLVSEFAAALEAGGSIAWKARVRPDLAAPYDAVGQLLVAALTSAGLEPTASPAGPREPVDAARANLHARLVTNGASALRAEVVVAEALGLLGPPDEAASTGARPLGEEREIRFEAWREALDALAAGRNVVWIVEDVHWAGADLLAFLESAGRAPRPVGRLIVTTARPALLESAPAWCADGPAGGSAEILELGPLAPGDAIGLVRALTGETLPDELAREVAERADGNPLFIEELLRTWVSVGTLVAEGDGWRLATAPEGIPLPSTVQSIYAAQLDDLSGSARAVARRGSVAGRRFPAGVLDTLDIPDPAAGVASLARRAFVSGPLPDPLAGPSYSYRHALLRDAGYASLARSERARLHVRIARWLEEVAGPRADDVAAQVAGHYAAALESAPSLAADVGDGVGRDEAGHLAAAWFERAAERWISLAAHDAARTALRRSLDHTPSEARLDAARRWQRLGEATAFSADMDEGRRHAQRAAELYRSVWADEAAPRDDREAARDGLSRASATLGEIAYQQIRFIECRDLAQEVLRDVGERDDLPTARLLVQRALGHYGETDEAGPSLLDLERSLAIATRLGDERLELEARDARQYIRLERGDTDLGPWAELRDLAERVGDWTKVVRIVAMPATLRLDDRAAEARAPNDEARDVAEAHGLTEQVGWTDYRRSEIDLTAGAWDDAVAYGLRAVELAEANAYRRLAVRAFFVLTVIAALRRDRELGERSERYFGALEGPLPDSPYSRIMRPGLDLHLSDLGLHEPFVPDVEERVASFTGQTMGTASYCAATERVFRAWLEHDLDGARRILPIIAASAALPGSTELARATADLLRARFLVTAGAPRAEAVTAARSSLGRSRALAAPWWIAKAIRALDAASDADAALLEEARAIEAALEISVGDGGRSLA